MNQRNDEGKAIKCSFRPMNAEIEDGQLATGILLIEKSLDKK
jgi:hypothetical protein